MKFLGLFLASIVVEGIISYSKMVVIDKKVQWQNIVAMILGILVSIVYHIDIFDIIGMESLIPYVGMILTGILISRGSNYIYEIIKRIMNFPQAVLNADKTED